MNQVYLWNYVAQAKHRINNPEEMSLGHAREFVPQTPRALRLFDDLTSHGKLTPYQIIKRVDTIIFNNTMQPER